jgi:hypothetical protein
MGFGINGMKICSSCNQLRRIWKNIKGERYCKVCWSKIQPPAVIPKQTTKRKKLDSSYSELRKEFLVSKPMCQAHISGICQNNSTDVHHMMGRGSRYLDTTTWLSVCRACHNWIELNPESAKQLGFSKSRLYETTEGEN